MISPPAGCREECQLPRSEIDVDGRNGTFRGISGFVLGFLRRGVLIGEGWAPGAWWGHQAIARRGPTLGRALLGCGALGAAPQVPFGLRKLSELTFMAEKISCNSEDIFRVGFLKPKTAENRELTLWHLVNRLVQKMHKNNIKCNQNMWQST